MLLVLLGTILVKLLPVLAVLWGMVAIAAAYEYGVFTPSKARRPRSLLRVMVLQVGSITFAAGVAYAPAYARESQN